VVAVAGAAAIAGEAGSLGASAIPAAAPSLAPAAAELAVAVEPPPRDVAAAAVLVWPWAADAVVLAVAVEAAAAWVVWTAWVASAAVRGGSALVAEGWASAAALPSVAASADAAYGFASTPGGKMPCACWSHPAGWGRLAGWGRPAGCGLATLGSSPPRLGRALWHAPFHTPGWTAYGSPRPSWCAGAH
jgi:hypothetical protein